MISEYRDLILLKLLKRIHDDGESACPHEILKKIRSNQKTLHTRLTRLREKGLVTCSPAQGRKRYTLTHAGLRALVRFGSSREHVDGMLRRFVEARELQIDEIAGNSEYEKYGALLALEDLGIVKLDCPYAMRFTLVSKALGDPKLNMRLEARLAQY